MMGNFEGAINYIKQSTENDGLVAVASQFLPIWRSQLKFNDIVFCKPIVNSETVYVFLQPNTIICFDKETGEHTATVKVDIENKNLEIESNVTAYKQYIYMGLWKNGQYFGRLNVNSINHGSPEEIQKITPEILWEAEAAPHGIIDNKLYFSATPVVYNNNLYISTYNAHARVPVELAGFNVDTKQMVFHVSFGGPEEDGNMLWPEKGSRNNPILIQDDIIYYLSWSISAWNIKTGQKLYRHVFDYPLPEPQWHGAAASLQAVYYKGKIFYTSGECYTTPDSFRNIHCIDAKTGKLVWNDIAKGSYALETNPIIAHGRLYVSQTQGLRVYEPETGKLIGVDKSFHGVDMGRNVLYKDYMICLFEDPDKDEEGRLVAVYVGK